jgi:hypothetical protein
MRKAASNHWWSHHPHEPSKCSLVAASPKQRHCSGAWARAIGAAKGASCKTKPPRKPPKQSKPRPSSGFHGVCANGKRRQTQIRYDNKQHHRSTSTPSRQGALRGSTRMREGSKAVRDKPLNYEGIAAAVSRGGSSTSCSRKAKKAGFLSRREKKDGRGGGRVL